MSNVVKYPTGDPFDSGNFSSLDGGDDHATKGSGGGGDDGGGNMSERMTRIETIAERQEKLISETRGEMIGIRGDIQGLERRVIDKMDENQKWVIALLISAILAPLFIALVAK